MVGGTETVMPAVLSREEKEASSGFDVCAKQFKL
jgi:hypothetical protein